MLKTLLQRRQTYALLAVALGFVALTILMRVLGLLDVDGTAPNATMVAASLALVGAYLGGALSIVGVVLKGAIDEQTERRLQLESERNADLRNQEQRRLALEGERNAALAAEAEQRLKIEAATGALQLCGTTSGAPAQPVQREGALYLLTSLNQHQLAVELVSSLIGRGEIGLQAACIVIDAALLRGTDDEAIGAANVLYEHAPRFVTPDGVHCPLALSLWKDEWAGRSSPYVRDLALDSMCLMLLSRRVEEWQKHGTEHAYGLVAAICRAWLVSGETSDERRLAGSRLLHVLAAFPETRTLGHPLGMIDTVAIRSALASAKLEGPRFNLLARLETWALRSTEETLTDGLAPA